jgi:hypothetical protein
VVRVLGYRSSGPGSIPGTTRKKSSGSGTGSTQPHEYNWGATWKKSCGCCLENLEYGSRDPSRWPHGTFYPQKLAITSPTSGGRSVDIVFSRTQTMVISKCISVWVLPPSLMHMQCYHLPFFLGITIPRNLNQRFIQPWYYSGHLTSTKHLERLQASQIVIQRRYQSDELSVSKMYQIAESEELWWWCIDTQNYWLCGPCLWSGILNTRKHNVSETGSLSVLRWREGDTYCVGTTGPVIEVSSFLTDPTE